MSFPNWQVHPEIIFNSAQVIPVLIIKDVEKALPLAEALFAGGIKVLEITLRKPAALDAVQRLTKAYPDALIGVGTVKNSAQLMQAVDRGAQFAISPGMTNTLLCDAQKVSIPLIPGVATASELMAGLELGYSHFKLFPAASAGGIALLRSLYSPFPEARFCPTGGINEINYRDYLSLPNVGCVGGSWIVPEQAIEEGNWSLITRLCQSVTAFIPCQNRGERTDLSAG